MVKCFFESCAHTVNTVCRLLAFQRDWRWAGWQQGGRIAHWQQGGRIVQQMHENECCDGVRMASGQGTYSFNFPVV